MFMLVSCIFPKVDTSFVSPTQLTAQISAELISVAGTGNIVVSNPSPGGGTSSVLPFNIPSVLAQPTSASTQTQARLGAYYFDGWTGSLGSYHLSGSLDFAGGSPVPTGTPSVDGIFPDLSMAADGNDAISMYDYASALQNLGTISGLQPFFHSV
jgi:hypothetical protein